MEGSITKMKKYYETAKSAQTNKHQNSKGIQNTFL